MDPLTRATTLFVTGLLARLTSSSPGPAALRLVASGASPRDITAALRLAEQDPQARHPVVALDEAFAGQAPFLQHAEAVIRRDEEALREGLRTDAMPIRAVDMTARLEGPDGLARALSAWSSAVTDVLAGLVVAVTPRAVSDAGGYHALASVLVRAAAWPRLVVVVLDDGSDALRALVPEEVRLDVDTAALGRHLASLGSPPKQAPPPREAPALAPAERAAIEAKLGRPLVSEGTGASLRRLLVEAGEALSAGRFDEGAQKLRAARMLCHLAGLVVEEAITSVSLGTALFSLGEDARSITAYARGRDVALAHGVAALPAQAALGMGAVHFARRRFAEAREAYGEAAAHAGDAAPLRIEAMRMRAECWAAESRPGDAMASYDEALLAVEAEPPATRAVTAYPAIGEALVSAAIASGSMELAAGATRRVEAIRRSLT